MQAFPGDAWLSTSLLHDAYPQMSGLCHLLAFCQPAALYKPSFPCNSPSNYPLDLVIRSPSMYFLLCEALVCPKLQMHSAGYQHYHVALSRFYACSDAMIAGVLIGINPCRAFAAGHILPFYMDYSCIAAACATNAYHPFVANPPCMQKHQPMLQQ